MKPAKYFRPEQIVFLSTDLRDGSQTPGINFHHTERVQIAQHLADAGIDVIEAGFPISSKTHKSSVTDIAKTGKMPRLSPASPAPGALTGRTGFKQTISMPPGAASGMPAFHASILSGAVVICT